MFDRFVGIPYADKGRTIDGCDCWGLLRIVYRHFVIAELPSYSDQYVTAEDRVALARLIANELDPWEEIEPGSERSLDAVLMREGRFPRHVGIVTEPGKLLHVSSDGICSVIERYRDGQLKNRVVGFYRYNQKANQ
jgi:cell wall-associated NlpC family hydrolase